MVKYGHFWTQICFCFGRPTQLVESQFPDQGSNLCPLQWTCGILTTGPPGNSQDLDLGDCYGLNCVLLKRYVEVLTTSTSEGDLIWKQGLYRGNQVKMRSLGWALNDWCPYKKRKFGHRHTQKADNVKTGRMPSTSQGTSKATYQKLGERHGPDFSSELPEGINPANTLISDFWSPKQRANKFLLFKSPSL